MEYSNKWLLCMECGQQFLWDAGEQAWYRMNNFRHEPRRCKNCRDRKKARPIDKWRQYAANEG